jgi:hypothetical protein
MTRDQLEELAKRLELGHAKMKALADAVRFDFDDSYLLEAAAFIRSMLAQEPVANFDVDEAGWFDIYLAKGKWSLYAAPVPAVDPEPCNLCGAMITSKDIGSTRKQIKHLVERLDSRIPSPADLEAFKAEAMRLADSLASDQAFYGRQDWHTADSRAAIQAHLDKIGGK